MRLTAPDRCLLLSWVQHPFAAAAETSCQMWFRLSSCLLFSFGCRPAGADEFGMRASRVQPWSPTDANAATAVDPWSCLRGCDKASTCLAVFTTKLNESWACWMIEGGTGLGFTASSVKVAPTQINAYLWAWTSLPGVSGSVNSLLGSTAVCKWHSGAWQLSWSSPPCMRGFLRPGCVPHWSAAGECCGQQRSRRQPHKPPASKSHTHQRSCWPCIPSAGA